MLSGRRRSRIIALQALYEVDMAGHASQATLDRLLAGKGWPEEAAAFARELVLGVAEKREEIDVLIRRFAPAWPLEQLPPVDRNILRLAIFEILHHNKAPVGVAINEAVELAKAFGSDSSPRFINGVLGSVSSLAAGPEPATHVK